MLVRAIRESDSGTPVSKTAQPYNPYLEGAVSVSAKHDRQERALVAYTRHGNVQAACKEAGIGRRTWYAWAAADPDFALRAEVIRVRTSTPMAVRSQVWRAIRKVMRAEFGDRFAAVEGKVRDAVRETIRSTEPESCTQASKPS